MGKVYESDIDPDEFIRSFREEPSGVSSLKKKPINTSPEPPAANKTATDAATTPVSRSRAGIRKDDEDNFTRRFVSNMEHMRPREKYTMVEIAPEFIRKIKRILSYDAGPACSLKAYVNNVLAEHFKEFEEIIKKRL